MAMEMLVKYDTSDCIDCPGHICDTCKTNFQHKGIFRPNNEYYSLGYCLGVICHINTDDPRRQIPFCSELCKSKNPKVIEYNGFLEENARKAKARESRLNPAQVIQSHKHYCDTCDISFDCNGETIVNDYSYPTGNCTKVICKWIIQGPAFQVPFCSEECKQNFKL